MKLNHVFKRICWVLIGTQMVPISLLGSVQKEVILKSGDRPTSWQFPITATNWVRPQVDASGKVYGMTYTLSYQSGSAQPELVLFEASPNTSPVGILRNRELVPGSSNAYLKMSSHCSTTFNDITRISVSEQGDVSLRTSIYGDGIVPTTCVNRVPTIGAYGEDTSLLLRNTQGGWSEIHRAGASIPGISRNETRIPHFFSGPKRASFAHNGQNFLFNVSVRQPSTGFWMFRSIAVSNDGPQIFASSNVLIQNAPHLELATEDVPENYIPRYASSPNGNHFVELYRVFDTQSQEYRSGWFRGQHSQPGVMSLIHLEGDPIEIELIDGLGQWTSQRFLTEYAISKIQITDDGSLMADLVAQNGHMGSPRRALLIEDESGATRFVAGLNQFAPESAHQRVSMTINGALSALADESGFYTSFLGWSAEGNLESVFGKIDPRQTKTVESFDTSTYYKARALDLNESGNLLYVLETYAPNMTVELKSFEPATGLKTSLLNLSQVQTLADGRSYRILQESANSAIRAASPITAHLTSEGNVLVAVSLIEVDAQGQSLSNRFPGVLGVSKTGPVTLLTKGVIRVNGQDLYMERIAGSDESASILSRGSFNESGDYTFAALLKTSPSATSSLNSIIRTSFEDTAVAPACMADFNQSGDVSVQDLWSYLAAYSAQSAEADVNQQDGVTVQDLFDYLNRYFSGC